MNRRSYLIRALEDCGYERREVAWWSDYALEYEYERLYFGGSNNGENDDETL